MTPELSRFAARLREVISVPNPSDQTPEAAFSSMALELFRLQYEANACYRKICELRGCAPDRIHDWREIPAIPASAFKELEVTALQRADRVAVFRSSGTTAANRGRHYHSQESLAVYEASLLAWFRAQVLAQPGEKLRFLSLTPPGFAAATSSLVYMFETIRREHGTVSCFAGTIAADGSWEPNFQSAIRFIREAAKANEAIFIGGTAFNFVHLLDSCEQQRLRFQLPAGSRVLETGGYKGRSRSIPKAELHGAMQRAFGIELEQIVMEYGMSELSSQAYSRASHPRFQFPPWARVQLISHETGSPVGAGETGLIRVFDLANVWSVMALQTEELGVRHEFGFELVGRAAEVEPRGCSLMPA